MKWVVVGMLLFLGAASVSGQEEQVPAAMSLEEIDKASELVLTEHLDYDKRVEIAASMNFILEQTGRDDSARKLCLSFYSSIIPHLTVSLENGVKVDPQFASYVQSIEKGSLYATAEQIHAYLDQHKEGKPPAVIALLALKSDHMLAAYFSLYAEFSQQRITPYGYYVLGILSARERRWIEAERFLQQARGKLGSPQLERWLTIDLTKVALKQGLLNEAKIEIDNLSKQDAQDPYAAYLLALYLRAKDQKDPAKLQLARLEKLLIPDPYLISDAAYLAIELNHIDLAARLLERFDDKVDHVSDWYQMFALLKSVQGQPEEAEKYLLKSKQVKDTRIPASEILLPPEQLKKIIASERTKRRNEIAGIGGVDHLAKVYLYLLERDDESAIKVLKEQIQSQSTNPSEFYLLATIQRRSGRLKEAYQTFSALQQKYPDFQPYTILAILADLSVQLNDAKSARGYYQQIRKQHPDSYQSQVAEQYLKLKAGQSSIQRIMRVTSLMSRYPQYAAPFLLSEIMNYWGDTTTFASVSRRLGTSQTRGLLFNEFLYVLNRGTRYKAQPFVGLQAVILEYLNEKIPVVFLQGDLFAGQRLHQFLLITGADPDRGIYYAEGATPYDPHLLTEQELLEGICLAIYPKTIEPVLSQQAQQAQQAGIEYVQLNTDAAMRRKDPAFDTTAFDHRRQTLLRETDALHTPHKLAYALWTRVNTTPIQTLTYLEDMAKGCDRVAQFWFLRAVAEFEDKKTDAALSNLQKAERMNPSNPRFSLARVNALFNSSQTDKAIELAENLRMQYPEDPYISAHLIALYVEDGRTVDRQKEETRLKTLYRDLEIQVNLKDDEHDTMSLR